MGTRQEGLWCRPAGQQRFQHVALPGGQPHERIGGLAEGPDGTLWVAGASGLARLRSDRWTRFTTKDGLRHDHVDGVRPTRGGHVLVNYYEPLGFSRLDPAQDRLEVISHKDASTGLASDMIYFLGEDPQGRIWVGTGRGLDVVHSGRIVHHGKLQGLAGEDCNAGAFLAEPNGRVWVGTSTGLSMGQGNWDEEEPPPPTILLSAVLGNRPISLDPATPTRLSRDGSDLQVHFAVPSFLHETGLESRYRFSDSHRIWRTAPSGQLILPGLPHGTYTLEVQSRSPRGPWGAPARLAFTITPAWWQPWWVKALTALLLALGLGRLAQRHWHRLRQRNLELETLLNLADQLTRELETANLTLQQESTTDPLTGLRNRRYLDSTLGNDLAHVERAYRTFQEQGLEGAPANADLVFMLVDIDHFKRVNDTFGHMAGDAVLQQFAEILRTATRGSDTIIRWGGEEFLIEARHSQRRDVPIVAERIRRSVEAWPFVLPDHQVIRCTCSLGFAPYPFTTDHPLSWTEAVDLADQCLYRAKTSGRNRWVGHVAQSEAEGLAVESPSGD